MRKLQAVRLRYDALVHACWDMSDRPRRGDRWLASCTMEYFAGFETVVLDTQVVNCLGCVVRSYQ